MFKDIRIESYRGLHNIELTDLGQINILVGENNSGKTSVLEAIQLFENSNILMNLVSIAKKREAPFNALTKNRIQPFDAFFYSFPMQDYGMKEIYLEAQSTKYGTCRAGVRGELYKEPLYDLELSDAERERYITYCDEDGCIRVINGEYLYDKGEKECGDFIFRETQLRPEKQRDVAPKRPLLRRQNIMYISPIDIYTDKILSASLYRGMLVEEKQRLLELMKLFDERIIGIETAIQQGKPVTMIEMQEIGMTPVSIFGDGLKKVLTLASAIVKMKSGVILIDEFETGIHKRALGKVAEWMASATKRDDVQVFLTTHSSEAISALVEAQEVCGDGLRAYRLEHYKNNIYVKKFAGNDLYILKNYQGMNIL